uniref:Uncharacterized protein n=1 Tax=Tetranychus urticae TaxID=32264 RepID=T1L583_TETUR
MHRITYEPEMTILDALIMTGTAFGAWLGFSITLKPGFRFPFYLYYELPNYDVKPISIRSLKSPKKSQKSIHFIEMLKNSKFHD